MAKGTNRSGAAKSQQSKPAAKGIARTTWSANGATLQNGSTQLPLDLQQKCLDIFRQAFQPGSDDASLLQEVKGHLYRRDFATAFGKDDYLRVYASRWSPSRALGYLQVFEDISGYLHSNAGGESRMVFLGGGAGGELVAAAAWLSSQNAVFKKTKIDIVDVADWSTVVGELSTRVTSPLELSKYASQAKRDTNTALIQAERFSVNFKRRDAFDMTENEITDLVEGAQVVTFMFTLNELYSASMAKTQRLLQVLKSRMQPGALLLVVDSPGSYSTVSINGAEKKYPMQWLLDYTLLNSSEQPGKEQSLGWEKKVSDDSRWSRLSAELQYPIELENMRYQIHLLKRTSHDDVDEAG